MQVRSIRSLDVNRIGNKANENRIVARSRRDSCYCQRCVGEYVRQRGLSFSSSLVPRGRSWAGARRCPPGRAAAACINPAAISRPGRHVASARPVLARGRVRAHGVMANVTCFVTDAGWLDVTGLVTGDNPLMGETFAPIMQRDFPRPTHKIVPAGGRQSSVASPRRTACGSGLTAASRAASAIETSGSIS